MENVKQKKWKGKKRILSFPIVHAAGNLLWELLWSQREEGIVTLKAIRSLQWNKFLPFDPRANLLFYMDQFALINLDWCHFIKNIYITLIIWNYRLLAYKLLNATLVMMIKKKCKGFWPTYFLQTCGESYIIGVACLVIINIHYIFIRIIGEQSKTTPYLTYVKLQASYISLNCLNLLQF